MPRKKLSEFYVSEESNIPAYNKRAVICFGRFQPVTKAHEKMFSYAYKIAQENNSSFFVFPTRTRDDNNPLEYNLKIKFIRLFFPKISSRVINSNSINTIFDVCSYLYKGGFTDLTLVTGSDRVETFTNTLNQYNGKRSKNYKNIGYSFNSINVLQFGSDRNDASDDLEGISSTKARQFAIKGDFDSFVGILPNGKASLVREVFNAIRKSYGLRETISPKVNLPKSEVRERYHSGSLFTVGEKVEYNNLRAVVERLGTNHIFISLNGQTKKVWPKDLRKIG